VTTMTVAQNEAVRAIRAVLVELGETQARLRARNHALSHVGAHQFDQRIPVPPEVAGATLADAQREMAEIDRELAALARCIDGEHARLTLADVAAQATIAEAAIPAYRRLVDVCERAHAALREAEATRLAFLAEGRAAR